MRMLDSWYRGRRERGHHVAHVRRRGDHGFGVHALLVFIRRIAQMILFGAELKRRFNIRFQFVITLSRHATAIDEYCWRGVDTT